MRDVKEQESILLTVLRARCGFRASSEFQLTASVPQTARWSAFEDNVLMRSKKKASSPLELELPTWCWELNTGLLQE
ncbi:hypothetical protein STEG23_022980 [Scotinomys teguina]